MKTRHTTLSIDDLPIELGQLVISHLPFSNLNQLLTVSHGFKVLIETSPSWKLLLGTDENVSSISDAKIKLISIIESLGHDQKEQIKEIIAAVKTIPVIAFLALTHPLIWEFLKKERQWVNTIAEACPVLLKAEFSNNVIYRLLEEGEVYKATEFRKKWGAVLEPSEINRVTLKLLQEGGVYRANQLREKWGAKVDSSEINRVMLKFLKERDFARANQLREQWKVELPEQEQQLTYRLLP